MTYLVLMLLVALFALNMGGSNFGASFAAAYGGGVITKRRAQILFFVFIFLGAVTLGRPVADTLGSKIIPGELVNANIAIIIILVATLNIWLANFIKVPQSTSMVAVASIAGVGFFYQQMYGATVFYLLVFWTAFPVLGYWITYFLGRQVYPPSKKNFWLYEKVVNHDERLKRFILVASCYNAFSVGTNNVANALGPLLGAGIIEKTLGLALIAPIFGLGGFVFHNSLETTGQKIVPLGILTATIICVVTGSLMLIASLLGVPQSFVMIKVACVFAVSGLKNGIKPTFSDPSAKKVYVTWAVTPFIAFFLSFALTAVFETIL